MASADLGRARTSKALRRQRRVSETLDRSWVKYARCKICRRRFVANNYADRKVRLRDLKIGGLLFCPWCKHRDGKFVAQLYLLAERISRGHCELLGDDETCKCPTHVARRILKAHDEAPTVR